MIYKDIQIIVSYLKDVALDLDKSLARRRFLKLFKTELETISETAQEISKKFAKKDAKGNFELLLGKIYQFTPENRLLYMKELIKFNEKEVVIDFSKNIADLQVCIEIYESEIADIKAKAINGFKDSDIIEIEDLEYIISILKTFLL